MKENFYKYIKEEYLELIQAYLTLNQDDTPLFDKIDDIIADITIPFLYKFKPSSKPLKTRIIEYCDKMGLDYQHFLNIVIRIYISIIYDIRYIDVDNFIKKVKSTNN